MSQAPVWVLLGPKTGDNNQVLALAEALGLPYVRLPLKFDQQERFNLLVGARLSGLQNPEVLPDYSPRLVISIGRRSPPVARWIRKRSGGRTRLVHLGRPWGPTWNLDLVLTTPQYGLKPDRKVVQRLFPFVPDRGIEPLPLAFSEMFASLPRPWTVVLLGGRSKPYVFDPDSARRLAQRCNERQAAAGGSVIALPSPRTPPECLDAFESALTAVAHVHRPEAAGNPYAALLHEGDAFIITSDSAMMLAEVLSASKPVEVFDLPRIPGKRYRRAMRWKRISETTWFGRMLFGSLKWLGLVTSTRDVQAYHAALREAGLLDDPSRAAATLRAEKADSVSRVRALLG